MTGRHDSWPKILAMVFCLTVVAVDQGADIPVADPFWWPVLYGGAAAALFVWRAARWRWVLSVFGAFLFVASIARGAAFLALANRNYAAAGLHSLVAVFAYEFVRNRPNGEHP